VFKVPTTARESALRKFTCLPQDILLIMGPRRVPPVACSQANSGSSVSILASGGFRQLEADDYVVATQKLRPDIVVGLADLVVGLRAGVKRQEKMVDRTHAFTRNATQQLYENGNGLESQLGTLYFAPILPLENTQQMLYLGELGDELQPYISGLGLYESHSLAIIPESLGNLPRLMFSEPKTPQDALRDISLGADLITVPFIGAASDGGIALDFSFPPPGIDQTDERRVLGIDMWSSAHATDLSPLVQGCQCYTCTKHHRAYVRHLLSAKEMLAWTLLQIHNYHIIDCFFAAVRNSIRNGTFNETVRVFEQTYQTTLPQITGQGPRYVLWNQASSPHTLRLSSATSPEWREIIH
jgi:queuine tRNA-ribosyltransferase accessory subunit